MCQKILRDLLKTTWIEMGGIGQSILKQRWETMFLVTTVMGLENFEGG